MSDDALKEYLPSHGDRIALKAFCNGNKKKEAAPAKRNRNSLVASIRRKLLGKGGQSKSDSEEEHPRKKSHLDGNTNAQKTTRNIKLGWLHFDAASRIFKQVRERRGGGTRTVTARKSANRHVLEDMGKRIFFENGRSKLGSVEDFKFEIRDFSEEILTSNETVGEMYQRTSMPMLTFYIATTPLNNVETSPSSSQASLPSLQEPNSTAKREETIQKVLSTSNVSLSSDPSEVPSTTVSSLESNLVQVQVPSTLPESPKKDVPKASGEGGLAEPFESLPEVALFFPFSHSNEDLAYSTYLLPDDSETEVFFRAAPGAESNKNETTLPQVDLTPVAMTIHRGSLAFKEMIGYFKDPTIVERQLIITRILPNGQREQGEDTGGVMRDLLTEFWTEFYDQCTLGRTLRVPSLRHDFGVAEWNSVARILVYGFKTFGYWPVLIAPTFMRHCIAPATDIPNEDLLTDFYSYVSAPDREVFLTAEKDFSAVDTDELVEALDMHECKTVPKQENFKAVLLEIAHKEIIQTPMFISDCWKEVLGSFIRDTTQIVALYKTLIPSNKKVCQMFCFPEVMDVQSTEVSRHLKRYVKNLDQKKLTLFLRFCTGSDLLTVPKISVEFCVMTGFQRRPIAHTCGSVLRLSKVYESYVEFRSEFDNVLNGNIWVIDIV